ncbi:MAG: hypothetical protein CSA38_04120 [Flavobacteriales bacterium]|nr:MAG: hypothetical protein CSA38_04120 [Flavobacteriales bacterium]
MSVITLTSDFGNKGYQVPAIKGSIVSLNPDAKVIDISHQIDPHNLLEAAHIVRNSYHFFPKGSVHIISVDSFYHKERKNIVAKIDGHYFICADNGLISLLFHHIKPEAIYHITLNNRFDDVVNFASVDIFAPCAVHLQRGGLPELIGKKIDHIKELMTPQVIINKNRIVGNIVYITHFGDVVTNISRSIFEEKSKQYNSFTIRVRFEKFNKIHQHYTDIVTHWEKESKYHGNSGFFFNQEGYLTFYVYKGSANNGAKTLFNLSVKDKMVIEFQ